MGHAPIRATALLADSLLSDTALIRRAKYVDSLGTQLDKYTRWDSASSGWTGRLVVGEYTTGTFCPFCQVHDVAFNTLLQRYPATAFVSLAYHYDPNMPMGDPADQFLVQVHRWYGNSDKPDSVHHMIDPTGGDNWIDGRSYASAGTKEMAAVIDSELRRPPEAFFHVRTRVTDGQVHVQVQVDSLIGTHRELYLRLLLVEDTVRLVHPLDWYWLQTKRVGEKNEFPLRREHHMVVRAAAHTATLPLGLPLSGPGTVQYTFDVAAIQRRHLRYRTEGVEAMRPYHPYYMTDTADVALLQRLIHIFPDAQDWRINPQRLHVVAFIQEAHTGAVLQAIMVKVPGARLQLPTS